MIEIKEKEKCCGCGACVTVCPQKCISFQEDTKGFWYPQVDEEKCIHCNQCEKVCPIIHKKKQQNDITAFVAYASNEDIRVRSSSGGLFTLLAEKVLDEGGVVFGAAFDEEFMVHHIAITEKSELEKLRGSKYLQSRIEDTFEETKNILDKGGKVLFSGMACQIAGLKQFLGKEYTNLITVDILCHGVPSPKIWKRYLEEQKESNGSSVKQIYFRNKHFGWKNFSLKIVFEPVKIYRKQFYYDSFMRLFMSNICFRESCYACEFKDLNRPSDITLGDCWGIENYMPDMDDDKGTSLVLIHSAIGKKLFQTICSEIEVREAEIEKVLPESSDSRKSVKRHPKREEFFQQFDEGKKCSELVKMIDDSLKTKIKRKISKIIRRNK